MQTTTRVVDEQGNPVRRATVAIYIGANADPYSVGTTDSSGIARIAVPSASFSLSANSVQGTVWIPDAKVLPDTISLAGKCEVINGQLATPIAGSEGTVHATILTEPYASYGASIAPDGELSLCVPAGNYLISGSQDFVLAPFSIRVPGDKFVRVRNYARSDVEVVATVALSRVGFRDFIDGIPRGAQVIGVGEANHGTQEFLSLRMRIAQTLAKQQPVAVMIEAGFGEVVALDRYIHGEDIEVVQAIQAMGYWMWNTKEFAAALEELRAINAKVNGRVRLLGFDVQDTAALVDMLTADAPLATIESDLVKRLREDRGKAVLKFNSEEQTTLEGALRRLASSAPTARLDSKEGQDAIAATALLYRIAALKVDPFSAQSVRDEGMAAIVALVAGMEPGLRIVAFAHNGHLAKEPYMSVPSMGMSLRQTMGTRYYAVGLFSNKGAAWAWNPAGSAREAVPLPAARPYSLEATLARAAGPGEIFLPIDSATPSLREWLATPHYTREFGAQRTGEAHDYQLRDLAHSLDAVVVVASSHATTQLPVPSPSQSAAP